MKKYKTKNKSKNTKKNKTKKIKINYQYGGVDNLLPIPKFIKNARIKMSKGYAPVMKSLTQITTNKTDLIKLHTQIDQLSIPQRKSVQALVNTFLGTK
jgi:hypothetical protein